MLCIINFSVVSQILSLIYVNTPKGAHWHIHIFSFALCVLVHTRMLIGTYIFLCLMYASTHKGAYWYIFFFSLCMLAHTRVLIGTYIFFCLLCASTHKDDYWYTICLFCLQFDVVIHIFHKSL